MAALVQDPGLGTLVLVVSLVLPAVWGGRHLGVGLAVATSGRGS